MIVPPNGSGGVQLGLIQSPTINFLAPAEDPNKAPEPYGNTGSSEGGLNDELLLHDLSSMKRDTNSLAFGRGREMIWHAFADQLSINNDPTFASDGHAIQAESNTWLDGGLVFRVVESTFGSAFEPDQVVGGTFENKSPIGLMNFEFSGNSPSPGSDRAVANLQVFDLDKFPLLPL